MTIRNGASSNRKGDSMEENTTDKQMEVILELVADKFLQEYGRGESNR